MLRAMSSSVSGLKANQTVLDIIGNNISNSSTTGYKSQRAIFGDNLSQCMTTASAPGQNLGGTNPMQIGLGTSIMGIDTMISQGNFDPTNRNLDCAIDGEGYFAVAEGPVLGNDDKDAITIDGKNHKISVNPRELNTMYTRDGSFCLDSEGNLLTSKGYRVLGYPVMSTGATVETDDKGVVKNVAERKSMDKDGKIHFVDADSVDKDKFSTLRTEKKGINDRLVTLKVPDTVKKDVEVAGKKEEKDVRVKAFSIDKSGLIKLSLEDGTTSVAGQIATVAFNNPAGLMKLGNNLAQASANSGAPSFKTGYVGRLDEKADADIKKNDNSKAFGNIVNGCLEMSNVDIAEQFTRMIEATRAFQANGKMITTSDEILQDLVNLKR